MSSKPTTPISSGTRRPAALQAAAAPMAVASFTATTPVMSGSWARMVCMAMAPLSKEVSGMETIQGSSPASLRARR